jgi:phospholipid-binding lipoprotein MlaA
MSSRRANRVAVGAVSTDNLALRVVRQVRCVIRNPSGALLMPRFTAPRFAMLSSLLVSLALLGGCATAPGRTTTEDPWQGMNRGIYKFNDGVDRAVFKPVAKGYQKVTPQWMRDGIHNFFNNLQTPWVMVNQALQGKPRLMAQDTCRFVLNSVVGLGGFIDVASRLNLPAHNEDFGQTLAVWGVPSGPYLMLPIFGPSTVRDGFGRVPDYYSNPQRYADISWKTDTGVTALNITQARESLFVAEGALKSVYDRYGVIRDVWLQRREYLIYDGSPPEPAVDEDLDSKNENEAAAAEADDPKDAPPSPATH